MTLFCDDPCLPPKHPPETALMQFGYPEHGYPKGRFQKMKAQNLGMRLLSVPAKIDTYYNEKVIEPHLLRIQEMIKADAQAKAAKQKEAEKKKAE